MSATQKFLRYMFGQTGDRAAVPDATPVDGTVNYQTGYGFDYQRAKTDPLAKNIERDKLNQVLYDLSLNQRQYQLSGVPEFVPAAENGGVAVSYAKNAFTLYTDGIVYRSLEAANVALPTDATKWAPVRISGSVRQLSGLNAPVTLTAANVGRAYGVDTGGTVTLPLAINVDSGATFMLLANVNSVVVAPQGGNNLFTGSGAVASITLNAGDTLTVICDGLNWYTFAGSGQLKNSAVFGASLAANGYQKLPSGLIVQWGTGTAGQSGAGVTNTFSIAFPTACQSVTATHIGTDAAVNIVVDSLTVTNFLARSDFSTGSAAIKWLAIGY